MEYLLTFGIGVLIIVAVSAVVICAVKAAEAIRHGCRQYDERQQRARGVAYRNGFLTLCAVLLLLAFLQEGQTPVLPMRQTLLLALFAGLAVFGVSCVMLDAYLGIRENFRKTTLLLFLSVASSLLAAWSSRSQNGMDGNWWLYLAIGVDTAAMLLALGVKSLMRRREDREDEE